MSEQLCECDLCHDTFPMALLTIDELNRVVCLKCAEIEKEQEKPSPLSLNENQFLTNKHNTTMHTTVAELIEKLQGLEPCARIVLATKDGDSDMDFSVKGYGNVGEARIICHELPTLEVKVKEMEDEIDRLETKIWELEEANEAKAEVSK